MVKLKMKVAAVTIILVIATLTLTAYAANTGTVSVYLPGDVNHDGKIDITDASLLAMSWQARVGMSNYNPDCDFNHDGKIDITDAAILGLNWGMQSVQAEVSIMPSTLNLKSKGNWITCLIRLPENKTASMINANSIKLNGTITPQKVEPMGNASNAIVVKFSREAVITLIRGKLQTMDDGRFSVVTLSIRGYLSPKVIVLGTDTVRIINFEIGK